MIGSQRIVGQGKEERRTEPGRSHGTTPPRGERTSVADVVWRDLGDGSVEVSGMLVETVGSLRRRAPSVGVAFFSADGSFVGAVVEHADGEPLLAGERRAFTLRGPGVAVAEIVEARAFAVIP